MLSGHGRRVAEHDAWAGRAFRSFGGWEGAKGMNMISGFDSVSMALSAELQARGFAVAGDTVGLRGALYIKGDGDRALALFEFKGTAEEAIETMYQGRWMPDMPPRYAVLPVTERDKPELDLLNQAGLSFLLYEAGERQGDGEEDGAPAAVFPELDRDLAPVRERRRSEAAAE